MTESEQERKWEQERKLEREVWPDKGGNMTELGQEQERELKLDGKRPISFTMSLTDQMRDAAKGKAPKAKISDEPWPCMPVDPHANIDVELAVETLTITLGGLFPVMKGVIQMRSPGEELGAPAKKKIVIGLDEADIHVHALCTQIMRQARAELGAR